jgi:hypothetical protein
MENEYQSSSIHSQVQWVEIFLKEYIKKRLTKRLFVASTAVYKYKPNLGHPSPASVLRIVDLVYS